ncbi:MAG: hypothetical protein ACYC0F_18085 [Rhodanobacter sp.]
MRPKAVIMNPDRTNTVLRIKKKMREGDGFRYDGTLYFFDAEFFQLTVDGRWPFRRWFTTFYYKKGLSKPLPVPHFQVATTDAEGRVQVQAVVDRGIGGEELASVFNKWFYRIIAASETTLREKLVLALLIGIACAVGYIAYTIGTLPEQVVELLKNPPIPPSGGGATVGGGTIGA